MHISYISCIVSLYCIHHESSAIALISLSFGIVILLLEVITIFTQNVLKILRDNKDEGFQNVIKNTEGTVVQMFEDAAKEEMEWAAYLFKDGSILGLNEKILVQYMKHLTNKRMRAVGLTPIFEDTPNPINWIQNWTESKRVQIAPQESEIESS